MGLRKLSPGGYEYLTGSVACGDRELAPGESLADYYFAHGYPPGEWVGAGAELLGVSGEVSQAQMTALFGEGRHPNADVIEARMITEEGASPKVALEATKLGNRFGRYGGLDDLRDATSAAYKDYNTNHNRPVGAPIDAETRAKIRHGVLRTAFAKAHNDRQPNDEKELNEWLAKQKAQRKSAVAGYEMVFAPPKSVSVAWALADAPTRELIESIHWQAVRDSLRYFEANAAYTRHGRNGIAQVDIDGIIAATFEHWDSRSGDPHLHTHVPISNKVRRSMDGHWTSLDGRTVFAANVPVSEFYNSRIRDLFREHGATFTAKTTTRDSTKQSVWELDGIPKALLAAFSQRTSQVETERARLIVQFRTITGREPEPRELLELSRRAKLAGRPTKQAPVSLAEHRAGWRQLAIQHTSTTTVEGVSSAVLPRTGTTADSLEPTDEASLERLAGMVVHSVQARHTRFNRWHLEPEAHRATAHLAVSPQRREQLVDRLVDLAVRAEGTVCLEPPTLVTEPAVLRRRDGSSVFVEHNTIRYTTLSTLRAEEALVAHARRFGGARVSERNLRAAIKAEAKTGATLNPGQRELVSAFATSGRRLQLALAPAGSGKTTAMRVLAQAWRAQGGRVFAFGPSARAAHELGESIDARPRTLHQLTHALDRGRAHRAFRFRRGDLLIIDEAVMAGTHTLHRVVDYALARGADVRLVGDDHQLGAVEAGGAVALIASDVGAERLHEIVRFTDPAQAVASLQIRAGKVDGLTYYKDRGWIADGSRETMRDTAHHAWRTDLDNGHHSLLIVPTIDDVIALNLQARALRLDRGHVDPHDTIILHDGTHASRGDYIVTRFNNRRLTLPAARGRACDGGRDFVKNGDTWRVLQVGTNGSLTVTRTDDGRIGGGADRRGRDVRGETIMLPARYVAAHVELAYAATVNRVQGMNCHSGHAVIPPGLTREQFYTLSTRGREANKLYVITHQHVADQHQETPPPAAALDLLTTILQRRGVDTSATETLRTAYSESASLATLVPRHDHAARLGDDARYRTQLAKHAPATLGRGVERALIQTLRNAHDAGHHTPDLLTNHALTRRLDAATDPAAVLATRITAHIDRHPPAVPRTVQPDPEDIRRWSRIVTTSLASTRPELDLTGPGWERVWRSATGGKLRGLDPDAALYDATGRLAQRPDDPLLPDHARLASDLDSTLSDQERRGIGHQPALPWLARIDFATVDELDGVRAYLTDINTAIATRTRALRDTAIADPPDWAHALAPRPTEPELAAWWEHLVGLTAAYRDTYTIDDTDTADTKGDTADLAAALGGEIKGNSPQARALRSLTGQWHALRTDVGVTGAPDEPDARARVRITAGTSTAAASSAPVPATTTNVAKTVSLAELIRQHDEIARHGDLARYRDLIAIPVPNALNRPAEAAVIRALRTANDLGWQPEHLLANPAITRGLDNVDDPAALLAWRLNNHTQTRTPPPPAREPDAADIARWQSIVRTAHPGANLEHPDWQHAWRIAAAAPIDGLNPDDAVRAATTTRHTGNENQATISPAEAITRALNKQRFSVTAYRPALPWLARPDHTTLTPAQTARLHHLNNAIRTYTNRLRDNSITSRPAWTQRLGPRPARALDAHRWNRALELAAAYRAAHNVRTTSPDQPLGSQPRHHSPVAHSWTAITNQWRNTMPGDNTTSTSATDSADSTGRAQAARSAVRSATGGRSEGEGSFAGELSRRRRISDERRDEAQRRRAAARSDDERHSHRERQSTSGQDRGTGSSLGC